LVPLRLTLMDGLFSLHLKQNIVNNGTNMLRKTMNLGSSWIGCCASNLY
jgi:hypothetical protein